MKTIIYGASDDLIEIDGEIYDEHGYYDFNGTVKASDGTIANLRYDDEGQWKFKIKAKGDKFLKIVDSVGDDLNHSDPDARRCSGYSDVMVLDEGIEWVKVGRKTSKKDNSRFVRPNP